MTDHGSSTDGGETSAEQESPIWAGDDDGAEHAPGSERPDTRRRRRRRGRRILAGCVVALLLVVGVLAATIYGAAEHLAGKVHRIPHVFVSIPPQSRPTVPTVAAHSMTFLLVGSDTRSAGSTTGHAATDTFGSGSGRSDVLMLVRLSPDRKSVVLVSIPRDTWVDIPGHGKAKINAALAFGGPSLAIRTVEQLTHIRIDHFAAIDFAGFRAMTDALGGVNVRLAETTSTDGVTFHAGLDHLNGTQALTYVRQRHGLPRGDLDRVQRQQEVLRAIMQQTISGGTLTNPLKLYHVLSAVTKSVSVDDTLSNGDLRSLALSLRNLRGSGATFMTAPISSSGVVDGQDVLFPDPTNGPLLWQAINKGLITNYLALHDADTLSPAPR